MLSAWRIVKARHAAAAFDGEGARLNGGRWNSPGVRVVYVSVNKSLAALETLVHLTPPVTSTFVAIPIEFEKALLVEFFPVKSLPAGWNAGTTITPIATNRRHLGENRPFGNSGAAQRAYWRDQLSPQPGAC